MLEDHDVSIGAAGDADRKFIEAVKTVLASGPSVQVVGIVRLDNGGVLVSYQDDPSDGDPEEVRILKPEVL